MSLIIHTVVPRGIIVCADSRATIKDKDKNVRYDDTAEKIVPFPNYIVVSHCGNSTVNNELSVLQFLYDFREHFGKTSTITDLPLKLLNEYHKFGGNDDTIFKISGFLDKYLSYTYTINTRDDTIELSGGPHFYGATYNGITDIAHVIMNCIKDYKSLSIEDAIDLTTNCLKENINVFKYTKNQSIGGECKTYIIDILHDEVGWLQPDGSIKPDKYAPNNALEEYEKQHQEEIQQELIKELEKLNKKESTNKKSKGNKKKK